MTINKKELKTLLDAIDEYDDAYYNNNDQLISDAEYDGLKDRIRRLHSTFKAQSKADEKLAIRLEDAATRVGAPPFKSGWPKVQHAVPMGSLNKANTPAEFKTWIDKCHNPGALFISDKLDGISVSLQFENGFLVQCSTRGDGESGEDITRNVKKMKGVPPVLINPSPKPKFSGYIRGEIVLLHSDWKTHVPGMKSPRNGAGGISKRLDGTDSQYLTVIAYTVEGQDFTTELESIEYIKSLGFNVPNYTVVDNAKDAIVVWQKYMDVTRKTLDYDIDGLVIRINDRVHQISLGEENHRPAGAIAFKFEAPQARTIVRDIVCQVGNTGHITPVAIYDDVELMGCTNNRASLHNFSLVKELGINVGAEILVRRAGDVIPYIDQVTIPNGVFAPPTQCPVCGAGTVFSGAYLVCPNKNGCPAQVFGRLNKWVKELGILEWGEAVLNKVIDSGKVRDVADLYRLTLADLMDLDRMGEKNSANLLAELDKYRTISLETFLGGLCIEGVATSTAKSIIKAGYDSLEKIQKLSVAQLETIPKFAHTRALAFHTGLIENKARINDILAAGVTIRPPIKGALTGKSICFTGASSLPRAKLQKMATDAGGEVKKSVGRDLSYLVIADINSTSSKAVAARKNGITLISEEQFLDMVKA